MKTFVVSGRCIAAPPPADWREHLAQMLGAKPRRIGSWAELGLYGALRCMEDAGEKILPQNTRIWVGSRFGPCAATKVVLEQMQEDLPMPLAFLQTQPSQLLALLAAQMDWKGQAGYAAGGDIPSLLRLAAVQAGKDGLLLGWLDEADGGESRWLRLRPCENVDGDLLAVSLETLISSQISQLRLTGTRLEVGL